MSGRNSLGRRIRSWLGLDHVDPERFPFLQKLERAEEDVALLRLAVVLVNGVAFLATVVQGAPAAAPAVAVLVLAFAYAVAVVLLQARPAFGEVSWSVATVALDAIAITAWLGATGGWASPYFPLWYVSIAAVGYRYNLPITTGVSFAYAGAYAGLCVITGGVGSWIEFGVRALYVPLTGAVVGLAAEGYAEVEHAHRDTRRRLLDAIHELDHRFASLLEDAPDRIVVLDREGRVEYANGPVDELGFVGVADGDARAAGVHRGAVRSALETRGKVQYVACPETAGASDRYWCRVAPIEDGPGVVGAVLSARGAPAGLSLDGRPPRGSPDGHGGGGPKGRSRGPDHE